MKKEEIVSNKDYKIWLKQKLGLCCSPHKGCNRRNRSNNVNCWKEQRNKQWKTI